MRENSRNIRDLCNHPWKRQLLFQDRIKWNKVWTSLDAIDDTQMAIDSYLILEDFSANNGGYLFVYGVMQALNIQQDAANNLFAALFDKTIDFKAEYKDLHVIREHRNNSIGHPTKRGNDKSFHLIGRASIKKSGFTLASYYPKTGEISKFENIDVIKCIEIQEDLIKKILSKTMEKLESDFEKHKNNFKGKKLADFIDVDFHYGFSKIYENCDHNYALSRMNFDIIFEAYNKIKKGLKNVTFHLKHYREFYIQQRNWTISSTGLIETLLIKKLTMNLNIQFLLRHWRVISKN